MTVELPILGLLKDRAMHGYELHQALEKVIGHFGSVSWGSLYPMLRKLEERGYLIKTPAAQERGPERLVYQITPAGEQQVIELLMTNQSSSLPIGRDGFLIKVAFFHLLDSSQRLKILAERHTALRYKVDMLLAEQERIGQRTNRYRRAVLDYALARLRTDLDWVGSLMKME